MIITRTPYRISFFGGGTDYETWYSKHGGAVISATIDKYCYISLREMPAFLGHKYIFLYSKFEKVDRIEDIEHPGIRGCLKYFDIHLGIEANHAGDLPARSGLGSSSAFTVGLVHALRVLRDDHFNKQQLAFDAINIEQRILQETVGIQDQIACTFGGLNKISIDRRGSYNVERIKMDPRDTRTFEDHLVMVFTGIQRFASEIAKDQVDNFDRKEKQLTRIQELVPLAYDSLQKRRFDDFGQLLNETWKLKRELSEKVSNSEIDDLYDLAISKGAYGGKVLGAGGGGFMLFMIPPEKRENLIQAMNGLGKICIPVRFENNGTQLILK